MVAFADLVAKVERLAVQVNRIVTLVDTAQVTRRGKEPDRLEAVASTDLARDLQVGGTAEVTNFPLSPHQDSWIYNTDPSEIGDDVNSSVEAAKFGPSDDGSRAKNAIAGRVLDLHDRLGGFIKPLPPRLFDQKR